METAAVELGPSGSGSWTWSEWEETQQDDLDIRDIRRYVDKKTPPTKLHISTMSRRARALAHQWKRLLVKDNVLYRRVLDSAGETRLQIVCPSSRSREVWRESHEAAAHAGVERTLDWIRRRFYWPNMEGEVRSFHRSCVACSLQRETVRPKAPLNPIVASYPLEIVGIDFLSLSRPTDTYQNILVATDLFTRYAWALPTRDQTAHTTVQALWSRIIQPFGCPARFHSDRGPSFESALMKQLCDLYGVSKSRTTPYHPQGNANAERFNQVLLHLLRSLEEEKQNSWPEHIQELVHAYNNTLHTVTGYTPSFLMFGRNLRLPVDIALGVNPPQEAYSTDGWVANHRDRLSAAYDIARKRTARAATQNKRRYNSRATAPPLLPGERVWLRDRNRRGRGKLCPWWDPTPFVISSLVGDTGVVYCVQPEKGGRSQTVHRNDLKLCIAPLVESPPPIPEAPRVSAPLYYGSRRAPPVRAPPRFRRSTRVNFGQPPLRYRN